MRMFPIVMVSACLLTGCNSLDLRSVAVTRGPIKPVYIVSNPEADQIASKGKYA